MRGAGPSGGGIFIPGSIAVSGEVVLAGVGVLEAGYGVAVAAYAAGNGPGSTRPSIANRPWPDGKIPKERIIKIIEHKDHRFGKFYLLDDGYWYTKDTARHGGVKFKRYEQISNSKLQWVADLDEFGKTISTKHKGPIGYELFFKDFHGVR